jgi:hypothetical protein
MALAVDEIVDVVMSHALASGYFDRVNGHEPKNAPGNGLSAAVWADSVRSVQSSGLSSTSAVVVLNVRLYTSMLQEPQDAIDPAMLRAVSALFDAYSSDFTLGGNAREVDLLGSDGAPLQAKAGYLNQDQKLYRVMTITLPVIVNDAWDQAE